MAVGAGVSSVSASAAATGPPAAAKASAMRCAPGRSSMASRTASRRWDGVSLLAGSRTPARAISTRRATSGWSRPNGTATREIRRVVRTAATRKQVRVPGQAASPAARQSRGSVYRRRARSPGPSAWSSAMPRLQVRRTRRRRRDTLTCFPRLEVSRARSRETRSSPRGGSVSLGVDGPVGRLLCPACKVSWFTPKGRRAGRSGPQNLSESASTLETRHPRSWRFAGLS